MSGFVVNNDLFGRYVKIPTGCSKEPHIYKVVQRLSSNAYCDVPIVYTTEKTIHSECVDVLNVIHCGVSEDEVIRVALKDCELLPQNVEPVRKWILCDERLPDNAKDPDAFRPKYQIYTSFGITEGWYGWLEKESGWYALIWFMDGRYEEWNVDFKRGDVPKTIFIPDFGKVKVYAWRDFPEPPKMDGGSEE